MKKQLDWHFWLKIVMSCMGGVFLLSFFIGTRWQTAKPDDDDEKKKPQDNKTNPKKPLRMQIMSINTLTLFFFLMSIQEYRTNEFLSPFGVDPDKIPPRCKMEQEVYTWIVLICCLIIVGYNYFMVGSVLQKANTTNVLFKQTIDERRAGMSFYRTSNTENIGSINNKVKNMKLLNADFMAEMYPQRAEFAFFVLIAVFSILMYTLSVLFNYGVLHSKMFKSCVHPKDNDRYYDPYMDE